MEPLNKSLEVMTCHDPCLAHLVIGLLQMLSGDSGDADLLHFLASRSHR